MKINEIVLESSAFQKGKDAVDTVLNPTRLFTRNASFQKGYNAVSNPMSLIKGAGNKLAGIGKTTTPAALSKQITAIKPHQIKQSTDRVANNQKLFSDDISNLKQTYHAVNRNTVKIPTDVNKKELLDSIRAAYNNQKLNDRQQELLSRFSKSL
jgi:hypothetical protein